MTTLHLPDLNALKRDQQSLLARAISIGAEFERLPPRLEETFETFLRAQALVYAQRHRTGIALGRDGMRLGLVQAYACVELHLQNQVDDDMNAALHELSNSTLSTMHQQGYALAFERFHTMQQESALLSQSKDLAICVDLQEKFERWCNLVPETWVLRLSDGRSESVDPIHDYRMFVQTRARLRFIRSFPMAVRQQLREARTTTYAALLHQVIVAFAIGLDHLDLDRASIEASRREFQPPSGPTDRRKELQNQITAHLHELFQDQEDRVTVHQDVNDALACLEQASPDATTFLLTVSEDLVADDPVAAAQAAAEDRQP